MCDVVQCAYVQEMGRWYEDDILISVDLDNGYYCNGSYGGAVIRGWLWRQYFMQRSTGSTFLRAWDIAAEEEIIYNYRAFAISSGWAEFAF